MSIQDIEGKSYQITLEAGERGDVVMPIPDEILAAAGWDIGDWIRFSSNGDGSFALHKVQGDIIVEDTDGQIYSRAE